MVSSSSSPTDLHLQSADEIQRAAGPLSLVTRVVRLYHQPGSPAEHLQQVCQEIAAATAAPLVALRETPSQTTHLAGTEATRFDAPTAAETLDALFAAALPQPSARSVDFASDSSLPSLGRQRVLGCRSVDGQCSLILVLPDTPDLASETAWLRALELIVSHRTTATWSPETQSAGTHSQAAPRGGFDFSSFHRSLDLQRIAATIANDARYLLQVDRASVLLRRGKRYQTIAVSGVTKVHRRSDLIQALERLSQGIAATGETFEHPGGTDVPPQIQSALDAYLDQSLVDRLRIVPLFDPQDARSGAAPIAHQRDTETPYPDRRKPPLGLLVIEQLFDGPAEDSQRSPALPDHAAVARHAAVAIRNGERYRRIFLRPVWGLLGAAFHRSRRTWTVVALLTMIALLSALTLVQVDHYVIAEGTLQPQHRQHIYAPHDGVVQTVHVQHGQRVQVDTPLVTLHSAELERQTEQLLGQIQTVGRRLSAVRSTRRSRTLTANNADSPFDSLAGEEQQLQAELSSLESQHVLLKQQLQQLQIHSPLAGHIVSWDLNQRIGSRPVSRGHELLTIADVDGPWNLELELADQDIGTVRLAQQNSAGQLPIRYALATAPEQLYPAILSRVAEASHRNVAGQPVVELEGAIGNEAAHPLRVGARVRAKIVCGRRSAGASWFSDVVRAFRKHVLFHFRRTEP